MINSTRNILSLGAACLSMTAAAQTAETPIRQAQGKPNILFIFADDQCYDTINALGNKEIQTPNLDRLVNRGMNFTHAYNMGSWSGAVCVASRAMLNTGKFVWRADKAIRELGPKGLMWSQRMQKAGYSTYIAGKWHVKASTENLFEGTGTVRGGMPRQTEAGYNRPTGPDDKNWLPWDEKNGGYWEGGKHWSEVLGDETVAQIETVSKSDKPFFIYAAFNAPHDPRQAPKKFVDMYPLDKISMPPNFLKEYPYKDFIGCSERLRDARLAPFPRTKYAVKVNRQEYYAIITHMDEQIGRMLDALEKSGKADNTYIFFTADHGLACGQHGLIGKQNMYDHSMRPPFIVCGPGIKGNSKSDTPIYLQDVMPTTIELAGGNMDGIEFKSINPLIKGEKTPHYDAIYGAYQILQRMITKDGFKLIYYPKANVHRLFNMTKDLHEMNDLAANPEFATKLAELKVAMKALQTDMGDPLITGELYGKAKKRKDRKDREAREAKKKAKK